MNTLAFLFRVAGLLMVAVLSATVGYAQALADRQIAARPGGGLYTMMHPLERSSAMAHNAAWLAAGARVPIGFEYVAERFLMTYPAPGIARKPIYATGRTLRDVLNELVALDPRYGWSETNGVAGLFDRSRWPIRMPSAPSPPRMTLFAENLPVYSTAFEEPKITLTLKNMTIRDILDRIVEAYGAAGWTVQYRPGANGDAPAMWISIRTFDNTSRAITVGYTQAR